MSIPSPAACVKLSSQRWKALRRKSHSKNGVIGMEENRCKIAAACTEDPRCGYLLNGVAFELEDRRYKGFDPGLVIEIEDSRCNSVVIRIEDPRCHYVRARW